MFRVQCQPSSDVPASLLTDILEQTHRVRWADCRGGGKGLKGQGRIAIEGLATIRQVPVDSLTANEVTAEDIQQAVEAWKARKIATSTITKRLNCLSAMGIDVAGKRPRKERALKWWLRPDQETKAVAWLDRQLQVSGEVVGVSREALSSMKFLLRWTTKTGLRIEETLRLTLADFGQDLEEVTVPGMKTTMSQATLPLGSAAQEILRDWLEEMKPRSNCPIVPVRYDGLYAAWRLLKTAMGWPDTATMKALRRSAARYLHTEMGLPLDMVRHYLRHESINTTMMYLHLTGGYGTDEMRRFLK